MKKLLLILAVLSTISFSTFAKDNGDDCNGRGSCSTNTPSSSTANANSHAYGGSVKSEIENSVNNTNKNSNVTDINNSNKNSNNNTIHTSNKNYNDNTNTNTNTNTNSNTNKNYNDNTNTNTNKNTQKQTQNQGQSQSTENSNNASQSVTVNGDTYKAPDIPVSSAYAPPAFPTSPCRIALSAGLSLMNIGGSFGGSTLDTQCDLRASAQAFAAIGDVESAEYLLCSLEASKKLPKCQAKLEKLNQATVPETTQTQISSIIK